MCTSRMSARARAQRQRQRQRPPRPTTSDEIATPSLADREHAADHHAHGAAELELAARLGRIGDVDGLIERQLRLAVLPLEDNFAGASMVGLTRDGERDRLALLGRDTSGHEALL